jgi:hypothetical protein
LAWHLADRGAGRIILCGRHQPGPDAIAVIDELRRAGTDIEVVLGDITDPATAGRLVAEATATGLPVRGIAHAAASIRDATVSRAFLGAFSLSVPLTRGWPGPPRYRRSCVAPSTHHYWTHPAVGKPTRHPDQVRMMTRTSSITDATPRTWATPARIWAGLGVVFLAFQAWVLGRWVIGTGVHVTFNRNADISVGHAAVLWGVQGLTVAVVIVVVVVLVRQCRRERRLTFDTAITIGFTLSAWQDPLLLYFKPIYFVNQYLVRFNLNWAPYFPGWSRPDDPQSITMVIYPSGLTYPSLMAGIWIQCRLTNWVAQRRPHWGTPRILAACILAGMVVAGFVEVVSIRTGIYSYPWSIQSLSLWGGHWYQYPLTQNATFAIFLTVVAIMRHTLHTHGTTPHIFRGAETEPGRRSTWMRLLAGVGLANALILFYVIVTDALGFLGGPIPIDTPSYLLPR